METNNPLRDLIQTTIDSLHTAADANTIIGAPIQAEGVTLIPVSRLSLGVVEAAALSLPQRSSPLPLTTSAAAAAPAPNWSLWLSWWSRTAPSSCCP